MKDFTVDWTGPKYAGLLAQAQRFAPDRFASNSDWANGCSRDYLESFVRFWTDEFQLDDAIREMNRFPQVMVDIDGLAIHAVHVVGEAEGNNPLLLVHGWPGSVYEFWEVIEPLAFPSRFGGNKDDAFDLVVPSLPGFGFSGKPTPPIGPRKTAGVMNELMRKLGYRRYLAQGGDWGSAVATWLALDHADAVRAIHLNYLLVQPKAEPTTDEERTWKQQAANAQQEYGGYSHLQATKPASLAYAMQDNPVAQAAWILERFHDWSDQRERSFEQVFTTQRLLTNILIYLMNDAFVPSIYYYLAAVDEGARSLPDGRTVTVPTAMTVYPDPRMRMAPRSWVEKGYNVTRWTEAPKGGHFAAMEAPAFFIDDLRGWLAQVRE
jgi:pimeloyl-ACP methyl ester carboxylesterase